MHTDEHAKRSHFNLVRHEYLVIPIAKNEAFALVIKAYMTCHFDAEPLTFHRRPLCWLGLWLPFIAYGPKATKLIKKETEFFQSVKQ